MKKIKKTKVIATLGPSSSSVDEILALIKAGMDIARINLSHGNRQSHRELVENVKIARDVLNSQTAILFDTRGPEIRVGELEKPVMLIEGRKITLDGKGKRYQDVIGVSYKNLAGDVRKGDKILLDDGKIKLCVETVDETEITCRILVGGLLTSRKRVSLPGVDVGLPSISDDDHDDILFGIEQDIDFIALSFVRRAKDVLTVKQIVEENSGSLAIIAKIENRQGVDNLEDILEVADGLMVARGDLGVEVAAEEVPVIQKGVIHSANCVGKPVITATQMLESMISNPSPTRAEASDVTNAVMDGSDAVMLSGETAMGKYPVDAVGFLSRCTEITEEAIDYNSLLSAGLRRNRHVTSDAIAYASCGIAADLAASAILSVTTSGSTARKVAMYRPFSPILALSPNEKTVRQLQIVRGVTPLLCKPGVSMDEQINNGIQAALDANLLERGDTVAITGGLPLQTAGKTNILRVHKISTENG